MSFTSRRIREEGALPSDDAPAQKPEQQADPAPAKRRPFRKAFIILSSSLLVLLVLAGAAKALVELKVVTLNTVLTVAATDLATDEHGYTNVLLLGAGDVNHDGTDLTDTIIVASLDPTKSKSVVLLSLPRDLYILKTEKMGVGRINELYRNYKAFLRRESMEESVASIEALRQLQAEIGRNLNLPIHYVVKVDFTGFTEAVDALGGVDLEVPEDIVDTQYPGPNYTYETFQISAGLQHLDGETALKYARSRHSSSDFSRSARQQQILAALGDKARAEGILTNPGRISTMLKILSKHVETTMTYREMLALAKAGKEVNRERIVTMQLNSTNGLYDAGGFIEAGGFLYTPPRSQFGGAFVLLPISIPEFPVTWKQIHALTELLFGNRAAYLGKPTFAVLNAGAKNGMGRSLRNELIRYGFDVPTIGNAPQLLKDQEESWIGVLSEADRPLAEFFGTLLHLPVRALPTDVPVDQVERITIVLGKDFIYRPIQDLLPTQSTPRAE
jgi:LCP family protein required for cell wall assembly